MKRFDDYLIVTDLDGTLYKTQTDIPKVNIEAIGRFTSLGGKFAVATGRGIEAARFITQAIDIPDPIIVNNGHAIYDYNNEELVYNVYLPDRIKDFTRDIMREFPSMGVEVYSDRELYVITDNHVVTEHLDYEMVEREHITFEQAYKIKWSKLLLADDEEILLKAIDYANQLENGEYADDNFKTIRTSRLFLEGVCKDINKGTAVHELARLLNVPSEHIFTIGNFYNDIELVQSAHGAWVKDSPTELYDMAEYITEKTCADGAFAEYVEYVMNKK